MKKLGFNIEEHRVDLQLRQKRAEDIRLKYEANNIAADNVNIARKALRVTVIAAGISLVSLVVTIVK